MERLLSSGHPETFWNPSPRLLARQPDNTQTKMQLRNSALILQLMGVDGGVRNLLKSSNAASHIYYEISSPIVHPTFAFWPTS